MELMAPMRSRALLMSDLLHPQWVAVDGDGSAGPAVHGEPQSLGNRRHGPTAPVYTGRGSLAAGQVPPPVDGSSRPGVPLSQGSRLMFTPRPPWLGTGFTPRRCRSSPAPGGSCS